MKEDFATFTFDPARHYHRVLQQQGRVLLDADGNQAIQRHLPRALALAMALAGPVCAAGDYFCVPPPGVATPHEDPGDSPLSAGHFHVEGMLCEGTRDHTTLSNQPYSPTSDDSADLSSPASDNRQASSVL